MNSKPKSIVALKNNQSLGLIIRRYKINDETNFCFRYVFLNSNLEFRMIRETPIQTTGLIHTLTIDGLLKEELISLPITPNEFLTLRGRSSITSGFGAEELIFMLQNNSNITILDGYDELWNKEIPNNSENQGKKYFIVAPIYIPENENHEAHFVTAIIFGNQENRKVQILDTSRSENEKETGNGIDYKEELELPEGKHFDFISNEYCNQGDRSTCGFFTMSACEIATQYSDYESLNKAFEDHTFQKKVAEDVNKTLEKLKSFDQDIIQTQEISQEEGKVKQGGQASSPLSLIKTLYLNSENENSEAKTSEVKKSETSFSPEKLPNIENKTEEQVEGL